MVQLLSVSLYLSLRRSISDNIHPTSTVPEPITAMIPNTVKTIINISPSFLYILYHISK
jgi:hypothetical protein